MNKYILLGCVCLIATTVSAQIVDTLSGLAVQGALTSQSAKNVGQAMGVVKQNQILSDLTQSVMEIKTTHMNGYTNVNMASVSGQPFQGLQWSIGPEGATQFYIQLSDIDENVCRYLISRATIAKEIIVNKKSGTSKNCIKNNTLRFIFD